jgi:hypothetical protein
MEAILFGPASQGSDASTAFGTTAGGAA